MNPQIDNKLDRNACATTESLICIFVVYLTKNKNYEEFKTLWLSAVNNLVIHGFVMMGPALQNESITILRVYHFNEATNASAEHLREMAEQFMKEPTCPLTSFLSK